MHKTNEASHFKLFDGTDLEPIEEETKDKKVSIVTDSAK